MQHRKKNFARVSKNLVRYADLKILMDYQDSYVEFSNIMYNAAESFDILTASFSAL